MRLHPYHTGRILARSPVLGPLGLIACRHHERVNGSGYPAGIGGTELDAAACLLAAADVFHALGEARPHRPALEPAEAARVLASLALDRAAVRAVLDAARASSAVLPSLSVGLTDRELDDSAREPSMTASTGTASTATITDVDVVRAAFGAFASGDLAALGDLLHADATWHHHNDDRLGGIHRGVDAIIAYLTESALLTAGTLRAEPQSVMADGRATSPCWCGSDRHDRHDRGRTAGHGSATDVRLPGCPTSPVGCLPAAGDFLRRAAGWCHRRPRA